MSSRPSKFVIAIARWGLMAGLAGIVMSALAFVDVMRAPDNADGRRTLLLLAAILLSLAFVLAPFVRRAFVPPQAPQQSVRARRTTLLDELREHGEAGADTDTSPPTPAATLELAPERSLASTLLIAAYIVFAVVLACVLWAIRHD